MGCVAYKEYSLENGGRVDFVGRKPDTWETWFVEVKRPDYHGSGLHDINTGVGQLLYYQQFDPKARLIIAFPQGSVKLGQEIIAFLESNKIQPWQLSPPEHPTGGPGFFNTTIKK